MTAPTGTSAGTTTGLPLALPEPDGGVRVRFAPAPSGDLHVGNVRTALYNWALARRHGGAFVFRVEDTDRSRATDEAYRAALDVLRWLGLDWDEGPEIGGPYAPYRQSERSETYRVVADHLLATGAAYLSYESAEELTAMRERQRAAGLPPGYDGAHRDLSAEQRAAFEAEGRRGVLRLRMPDDGETRFTDLVRGEVVFEHALQSDPTLTRADGLPLYLLAASTDDVLMGMTHIVRGEDLLSSVPRQLALYRALGLPADRVPQFAHLPLITGPDGKPLSKRHGETSLAWYRQHGFTPEAMVNYLTLLGFSLGDDQEVFGLADLVQAFDLARVSRNPARFDAAKLEALNGDHIRLLAPADLAGRMTAELQQVGLVAVPPTADQAAVVADLVPLVQTRLARLTEVPDLVRFLLVEEPAFVRDPSDEAAVLVPAAAESLRTAADTLADLEPFDAAGIEAALRAALVEGLGQKPRVAFRPLYVAICGRRVGPPVFDGMALLGRERTVARLRDAADAAAAQPGATAP